MAISLVNDTLKNSVYPCMFIFLILHFNCEMKLSILLR